MAEQENAGAGEGTEFKFKNIPTDYRFVDAFQCGIRNSLFQLSLGIKSDLTKNEGEILYTVVMEFPAAKELYRLMGIFLVPPPPPTEGLKRF